jgi:transcriptional regulator with XRE-family HTH domain
VSPVITTLEAPPSAPSAVPSLAAYQSTGEILQSVRLQQGLSLDDIALQTFIKKNYLEALEEDRLEDLPAAVYSCGYIRQYARLLGLNDADLVQHYQEQWAAWGGESHYSVPFRPVFSHTGKYAKMENLQHAEESIEETDTMENAVTLAQEIETAPVVENIDGERQQLLSMRYQTEQFADQVFLHLEQEIEKTLSVVQNGRAYLQERLKTYSF